MGSSRDAVEPASGGEQVGRRALLKGGAVLGGALGVGAAGAAVAAPARADDGQPVVQGAVNDAQSTTTLRIDGTAGGPDPTLHLRNAAGPSLLLQPLAGDPPVLRLGEVVNTYGGPYIGVGTPADPSTVFLATELDLLAVPTPEAIPPQRLVDTRSAASRATLLATSPGAFDAAGRLRAGATMDVAIGPTGQGFVLTAAYLNLTAVSAAAGGFLSAYPPGPYPGTSTLNYARGQTIANAAFCALAVVRGQYAVRVRAASPTFVLVDLTGAVVTDDGSGGGARVAGVQSARRGLGQRLAERVQRALGR